MVIKDVTKYFGFGVVLVEWLGLIVCVLITAPNWSEPASQFGYYTSTRIIFGATFTSGAILYYLFSRHLNAYWRHSSLFALLAGLGIVITAWVPYKPYVNDFIIDVHNLALVLAILLYATPLLFISYKKVHKEIARASHVAAYTMFTAVMCSLVARSLDFGVIISQLLSILPFHAWLITVNILLLRHHKEISKGHVGKL